MRAGTFMTLMLATSACAERAEPLPSDSKEIERSRSPDGKVDAILYVTPTDPLSSDIQSVRLEPVSLKAQWHGIIARATHTQGKLGLRWRADTLLEIVYRRGHIYDFNNQWWAYGLTKKDEPHFVEIQLSKEQ
jgi:hypothetical protein